MKRNGLILLALLFALICSLPPDVDARRLGGGRSFGSRPLYRKSAPPPPQRDTRSNQRQDQASPARPSGFLGGRGGMLGGLLMGGLIGSLLFGGGHGFAGPNLLDILIIAGGIFLLFRFLRSRQTAAQADGPSIFQRQMPQFGGGGFEAAAEAVKVPPGFDEAEFIKGAKAAYTRLQASWNKRDLEDIRQFTTPEVWEEIRRQAAEDPTPGETSVVSIKAELLEVKTNRDETVATVLFDVLLWEGKGTVAEGVREIWHFSRKESGTDSFWRLEGIQQIEKE